MINLSPDRHTKEYNALKECIAELKRKINNKEPLSAGDIIALDKDSDELESLYIQDMRNASTNITKQTGEFQKRHQALVERLIRAETRLQAIELETNGFGKFLRHVGQREIEDALGNKHKIPLVYVRDMRGLEGRVPVIDETIDPAKLRYGQRLVLLSPQGPSPVIEALDEFDTAGSEASVVALMDPDREGMRVMLAFSEMGDNRVCRLAHNVADKNIGPGSRVLVDPTGTLVIEVLPEKESSRFLVDEIPTTTFADIGGLDHIAAEIKRDFLGPMLYPEKYAIMGLPSPRGCVFSGPPGTGKTLIARAVVNLMAAQIEKITGAKATGHFFHVGGPELLNKWVGETESRMREIFKQAKKIASPTSPVVIFFDEMDSLFAQRGTGISSDVNLTNVPQFTSLMDGLENRGNVIVVGATNRLELIDSAVLRPGRCDKVFHIPRPDAAAAKQIFAKYLLPAWGQISSRYNVPVYHPLDRYGNEKSEQYDFDSDPHKVAEYLIERAVERMYDTRIKKNEFVQLMFNVGGKRKPAILRYGDLASGALIANIVERAKKLALYENIEHEAPLGVEMKHLYLAIEAAFAEQRAPKTLEDIHHWLLIEGKAEGTLVAPPMFIDHTRDTPYTTDKQSMTSQIPPTDHNNAENDDTEEIEEF